MVSKNQIKLIASLHQKKYRKQHQLFIAEGQKTIQELLDSDFVLQNLYLTGSILFDKVDKNIKTEVTVAELKKMSALATPNNCLAVFQIPSEREVSLSGLIVALDDVRDPGNLGTIIRLCDWFGIETLVCSEETVDVYNPKVVQATMGSIGRVNIVYTPLESFFKTTSLPILGTFMDGESIYKNNLPKEAVIVMGNEANGISSSVEQMVTKRIAIPRFGNIQKTESLNVATATAIVLSELRR